MYLGYLISIFLLIRGIWNINKILEIFLIICVYNYSISG